MPDCRSYVAYRGALQGKGAHTVWVGDVLIRAEATGTDTYEINRNLLLTDAVPATVVSVRPAMASKRWRPSADRARTWCFSTCRCQG